jgi:hypothetical protein
MQCPVYVYRTVSEGAEARVLAKSREMKKVEIGALHILLSTQTQAQAQTQCPKTRTPQT